MLWHGNSVDAGCRQALNALNLNLEALLDGGRKLARKARRANVCECRSVDRGKEWKGPSTFFLQGLAPQCTHVTRFQDQLLETHEPLEARPGNFRQEPKVSRNNESVRGKSSLQLTRDAPLHSTDAMQVISMYGFHSMVSR